MMHEFGGRAKAMVVTGSRLSAVKYKLAFDRYIKEQGLSPASDHSWPSPARSKTRMIRHRLHRSGDERWAGRKANCPKPSSGTTTGCCSSRRSTRPGFDQPLLQTMYVVKRLAGVQAVQTLSRLNRIAPGKTRTFVLDFENEEDDIFKAFKPYYETTPVGENADPQSFHELQHKLLQWAIFTPDDVTAFAEVWYQGHARPLSGQDHRMMNAVLDRCVERFEKVEEEDPGRVSRPADGIPQSIRFLSQIIPYFRTGAREALYLSPQSVAKLPPAGRWDEVYAR